MPTFDWCEPCESGFDMNAYDGDTCPLCGGELVDPDTVPA